MGWSGESGSSDDTSDAESEEGEEEHAPLTASPWGTQKRAVSGLRMHTRAGGSGDGKATSRTAEQAKMEGAAREGRAAFSGKKEDNAVARSHHTYPYLV